MDTVVETGVLRGRPFGGVMILAKHSLTHFTTILCASERLVVIKIGNVLICNVYFPCVGTSNRDAITEKLCFEIDGWLDRYRQCAYIVGGDFNMDDHSITASVGASPIRQLIDKYRLQFRAQAFGKHSTPTYISEALGCKSSIDHFLVSCISDVKTFEVLDPAINYSDHVPIAVEYTCKLVRDSTQNAFDTESTSNGGSNIKYFRWDYADIMSYYYYTGEHLRDMLDSLNNFDVDTVSETTINSFYDNVVDVLNHYANCFVPQRSSSFFKFWWDEELDILKSNVVQSCASWRSVGKPRSGAIFNKYRADKQAYKRVIDDHKRDETLIYSNDLHDALIEKQGPRFWRVWRSKFGSSSGDISHVDGVSDESIIVDKFVNYFKRTCNSVDSDSSARLHDEYVAMRSVYCGDPYLTDHTFDACLVERTINDMKRGKAAGLDKLTAEHLQYCHSLLPAVLAKLFNLVILTGYIPAGFGCSYTVPIPKQKSNVFSKAHSVDDFRGISISPVISKVFEHCILARFRRYFENNDNQFSYKKKLGCTAAVHTFRCVVDHYVRNGSTVNVCALDLSKAFDRIIHHGLYIKLMQRQVPIQVLRVIEQWFHICVTCVKWRGCFSPFFRLNTGTRQGGVLSPVFFNIYIDDVISSVNSCGTGCYMQGASVAILVYADDILLLAPSISSLQLLVDICYCKLKDLCMEINVKKTVCMRIGPGYKRECAVITVGSGLVLSWVDKCRYLGTVIMSHSVFKCDLSENKKSFYRAFNATYGRIGRVASEDVVMQLLKLKCLPILVYSSEVQPLNSKSYSSLDFAINSVIAKVFLTKSNDVINDCREAFGIAPMKTLIADRRCKFLSRLGRIEHVFNVFWPSV
jgi:Reverse transcriptase (RNA-dependent DNA polymerase)